MLAHGSVESGNSSTQTFCGSREDPVRAGEQALNLLLSGLWRDQLQRGYGYGYSYSYCYCYSYCYSVVYQGLYRMPQLAPCPLRHITACSPGMVAMGSLAETISPAASPSNASVRAIAI